MARPRDVDSKIYGTSLLKGLQLLKCFTSSEYERGVTELAHVLGLAKSTVLRIARSLEAEGFLHRVPATGRYRLGLVIWSLGNLAFERSRGLADLGHPYLAELVDRTRESAQTVILDGLECVRLDKVEASQAVRAYMSEGGRFPAYVSAAGQALLAYQPRGIATSIVSRGLQAYTPQTITTTAELERRLETVRRLGYAVSAGEYREDVGGFGAPVRDGTGTVVGALGIVMPMSRFPTGARGRHIARLLVEATTRLSRDLGYIADTATRDRSNAARTRTTARARASIPS